ncbi:MAG: prolyl oligopeptidase family serine peptidase [Bacteroidia bacterium]|nr:prolyl oligopeptidase family serine peptidase [Bacteroidia bacterium]
MPCEKPSDTRQYGALINDTTLKIQGVDVDILAPRGKIAGDILMLPGWNFRRTDCCEKSSFCEKARQTGFRLIMPEMGKSVYSGELYPETRADWKKYPTRKWLLDSLIPFLQKKYGIFLVGGKSFMYGISTGARGVALLAVHTKNIFIAGAALSGDYDQSLLKTDNLMSGYYGPYNKFPERWEGEDNPCNNIDKISVPLYLAHGKKDKIVPCSQTELFFRELKKKKPELNCVISVSENAEHDYKFWDSKTDNILSFLKEK